jgi:hypothetical protein
VRELGKIREVDFIDLTAGDGPPLTGPEELGRAILTSVGPA